MTIDRSIEKLTHEKQCFIDEGYDDTGELEAYDTAISIMRKYQKMLIKYEILTASFEDSDSPEARSKKVDDFCIDTMRGLLGEYYAERIEEDGLIMRKGHSITKNDDSVKQKLLDSLAEEPTMVISTAYAYAKNYVLYGVDITKAWTSVVEQASILEQVKIKAKAEVYDYFKKDYEKCLKAEKIAMLEDLDLQIDEMGSYNREVAKVQRLIRDKINALKGENNGIHEN